MAILENEKIEELINLFYKQIPKEFETVSDLNFKLKQFAQKFKLHEIIFLANNNSEKLTTSLLQQLHGIDPEYAFTEIDVNDPEHVQESLDELAEHLYRLSLTNNSILNFETAKLLFLGKRSYVAKINVTIDQESCLNKLEEIPTITLRVFFKFKASKRKLKIKNVEAMDVFFQEYSKLGSSYSLENIISGKELFDDLTEELYIVHGNVKGKSKSELYLSACALQKLDSSFDSYLDNYIHAVVHTKPFLNAISDYLDDMYICDDQFPDNILY